MRLSITTVLMRSSSTRSRTRCANSPGDSSSALHLLDEEIAAALHRVDIDAEALHARKQQAEFFVEYEQRRLFAPRDGGGGEDDRYQRFAGAGRSENERAESRFDAAAEKAIQTGNACSTTCL